MAGVDGYPHFRLKALSDAGTFKAAVTSGSLTFSLGKFFPPFAIKVDWSAKHSQVTLSYRNGASQVHETVDIAELSTTFGTRRYFLCPLTRKRCTTLYLVNGRFGGRRGFGFTYSTRQSGSRAERLVDRINAILDRLRGVDGRGPARGVNRRRLLARLMALDAEAQIRSGGSPVDWFPELLEVTSPVDQERAVLKQRRRRTRRENGLDTASAYDRALRSYPPNVEETLRRAAERLDRVPWPPLPHVPREITKTSKATEGLPSTVAILEDHARLDLRVLVSEGLFKPGEEVGLRPRRWTVSMASSTCATWTGPVWPWSISAKGRPATRR